MAISTYKIFLMHKASDADSYTKLVDIKDFPDLGGAPEMLETTTLADDAKTYIQIYKNAGGKIRLQAVTEPTAVFTYSEDAKTYVVEIDGKNYCIDGQMTMKVLKARNAGRDLCVKCRVYDGLTMMDAATMFVNQRGTVSNVTLADKIRVKANYGDKQAIDFMRITEGVFV